MERLWAPWRMEYILKNKNDSCFLCDIIASGDDQKNFVLVRGEFCLLVMNRYPYNNGHLMVAPYRHVDSLEIINDSERLDIFRMISMACTSLRQSVNASGFNVGFNLGASAGAGLKDHIHAHVVPRWDGDTNFMPVISNTKVIPQTLDELWHQISEVLKTLLSHA